MESEVVHGNRLLLLVDVAPWSNFENQDDRVVAARSRSPTACCRTGSAFLGVVVVLALLSGCGARDARTLRLAHSLDVGHPVHQALIFMAGDLEARSGGRLQLVIYPGEQLGSEREALELLQIGSLDLAKTSTAVAEAFVPEWGVFGLPYLFPDRATRLAVLAGPVGRALLEVGIDARLRGLAWLDAGSRSFYTRDRPIRHPDDLAGLKIRVQESPSAFRMVRALGGSPTPIAWGELYTALEQGVVDGAENNPPSFHLSRHYEVARFLSLDEHTAVPDLLLVSTVTWDALGDDQRGWLAAAAKAGAAHQAELWQAAELAALEAVADAGVTIIRPDRAPFAAKVAALSETAAATSAISSWLKRLELEVSRCQMGTAPQTSAPQTSRR